MSLMIAAMLLSSGGRFDMSQPFAHWEGIGGFGGVDEGPFSLKRYTSATTKTSCLEAETEPDEGERETMHPSGLKLSISLSSPPFRTHDMAHGNIRITRLSQQQQQTLPRITAHSLSFRVFYESRSLFRHA
ncbi:hypothetical protein BT69DRAFT_1342281, partial [Atractiella rhizophila]